MSNSVFFLAPGSTSSPSVLIYSAKFQILFIKKPWLNTKVSKTYIFFSNTHKNFSPAGIVFSHILNFFNMIRKDISRLRKNRALHFQIGLCTALFFSITCLNWTVIDDRSNEPEKIFDLEPFDDYEVIRTSHPKPKTPPPPKVSPIMEIIPDKNPPEIEFKPEEKRVIEVAVDTKIERKAPPQPVTPPPPPKPVSKEPDFFKVVEEMPQFGGCDDLKSKDERKICSDKKMMEFIYSKIKYPSLARENGIEGIVVIQFLVDKKGDISHAKIVREIGGGCGKEALRIVNQMPAWSPGKQRGVPVKVQFNLPVRFRLD